MQVRAEAVAPLTGMKRGAQMKEETTTWTRGRRGCEYWGFYWKLQVEKISGLSKMWNFNCTFGGWCNPTTPLVGSFEWCVRYAAGQLHRCRVCYLSVCISSEFQPKNTEIIPIQRVQQLKKKKKKKKRESSWYCAAGFSQTTTVITCQRKRKSLCLMTPRLHRWALTSDPDGLFCKLRGREMWE